MKIVGQKGLGIGFLLLILVHFSFASEHSGHVSNHEYDMPQIIFGLLELPFLILCVVYAFLTAKSMKGGVFSSGMKYMAWGFLVMAVGHLHMQIDHIFGFNLFKYLLGDVVGQVAWVSALIITWALSGYGFYRIYKASK